MRLRRHGVRLACGSLALRPLTEGDWGTLLPWCRDPEVVHWSEGTGDTERSLEEVQAIYREASRDGHLFVIEADARPVGDAWIRAVHLERVLRRWPSGWVLLRIDLQIGDAGARGRGLGRRAIALLVRFGFEDLGADCVFACDVAEENAPSRRAFAANGFVEDARWEEPGGRFARLYDLVLTRSAWRSGSGGGGPPRPGPCPPASAARTP